MADNVMLQFQPLHEESQCNCLEMKQERELVDPQFE